MCVRTCDLIWFAKLDLQIDSVHKFMIACTPSSKDYFLGEKKI